MSFKKEFAWGTATASYQIEGAYDEDGKGLSIWDVFTHETGNVFENHTGDTACDHYHRFKEDVALMKELGTNAYRFSLSWARIFPDGTGKVNEKGLKFYSDLIDELISNGIEPYVTLFHWDLPYALHKKGGWLNDDIVGWFAEYAGAVAEAFSDRVRYFITFNEPQCFIGMGYATADHAPGLKMGYRDVFQMCHNVLKAHGAAVIAMRDKAKQEIKIGYAPTGSANFPATDNAKDIEAAREMYFKCPALNRGVMWNVSWWSDPVILGRYPEDGIEMYKEYLPEITKEDMRLISQPIDFYGQNIYTGKEIKADSEGKPVIVRRMAGYDKTCSKTPITPQSMYWGPKFLYERYKLPIYITESGMSAHDIVSLDGMVHDPNRIEYLHRYLSSLERASDSGVEIGGYFVWSLMDNFEWAAGYADRYGLVYVDFKTQKRIIKDSGYWYRDWIRRHSD